MTGRWVSSLLTVSLLLGMGSLSPRLEAQTVLAQGRMSEREVIDLLEQGLQQTRQEQPLQAITTLERALGAARQGQYRDLEAVALLGIARNYDQMGQRQKVLESYEQALIIFREVNNRSWEATTLTNIGAVYDALGERHQALNYYNQALSIRRDMGDRSGEAATLTNIGAVYDDLGDRRQALNYYNQALPIQREVGDRSGEATTLNNMGLVYHALGERGQALNYYNQSLEIGLEVGDRAGEAATLNNIGQVYDALGNRTEALNYFRQALPMIREVGDRFGEATILNNVGMIYHALGDREQALEYFNQALSILQEIGDRSAAPTTLNNVGMIYHALGDREQALEYFNQALSILQEIGDHPIEASVMTNIGGVYDALGDRGQALEYFNQALSILREVGDRSGEANTLNSIGGLYNALGNYRQALDYLHQALLVTREISDRPTEAASLVHIALVYNASGNHRQAMDYLSQALPIAREVSDRPGEAATLTNMGFVHNALGNHRQALEYLRQALPITREVSDRSGEARTLSSIGVVYSALENHNQALNYYNQALPILREVGDRPHEITTLSNLAAIYRDTNQPDKAITYWEDSLNILLELRGELQKDFRETFLQTNRGEAVALVDLLIDQNQPQRAFEWANRVTTYELADYNRLIGVRVANPEAQAAIDDWNNQHQQVQALRQQLQDDFSEALADQMRDLEAQVNQQAETLANSHPEVAELFEIEPEDLSQLQASLPSGTVVLQPVLLTNIQNVPDSIALFLLSRDHLSVQKVPIDADDFNDWVTDYRQMLQSGDSDYLTLATPLYDHLIRPISEELEALNPQRLAIIATGSLRQFPFETLWDSQEATFLLEQYPIHYLTRLSSRSRLANPASSQTFPLWLIPLLLGVLGLGATLKQHRTLGGTLIAAAFVSALVSPRLVPGYRVLGFANPQTQDPFNLPGTEAEVDALLALAPDSEIYRQDDATLEQFKRQSPRHRYLHLATHGCFQQLGCCLSGNEICEDQDQRETHMEANTLLFADGEYPLADAALLGLEDTELVALTACQTALQTNRDGDAIMGMAYVWERAGARALMATLWNVDDAATEAVVSEFYRLMMQEGLSKAEALRQAKLSQVQSHPYFWSPLILIGDPR